MINAYLNIKNALALKNHKIIKSEAEVLIIHLRRQMNFSDGINQPTLPALNKTLQEIYQTVEINEVYKPFAEVIDLFYELLDRHEIKNLTLFRQYCPMAFDNEGDSWLSVTKEILNPYFGEIMLNYGHIDKKIN